MSIARLVLKEPRMTFAMLRVTIDADDEVATGEIEVSPDTIVARFSDEGEDVINND